MADTEQPSPDRIPGVPHPRETTRLIGQAGAERAFLEAFNSQRLHHAWLITGPRGVGKATLAWQLARFLLATPDPSEDGLFGAPPPVETLRIDPEHPVTRRMLAGAEPGVKSVTRTQNEKTGRMRGEIVVDDIRALASFFQLSAADGGRRIVIIDSADELNTSAANALLKMLEEPPEAASLFLIAHQPSRLLPTIRSRCRTLRLNALSPEAVAEAMTDAGCPPDGGTEALTELAAGSVGDAIRLTQSGGVQIYREIVGLLGTLPQLDRGRALALAEAAAQRGAEEKLDLLFTLLDIALTRLARAGASGQSAAEAAPDEAAIFARLAPHPVKARHWAETAQSALARARHGRSVNLDPAALVLDTLLKLQETARA